MKKLILSFIIIFTAIFFAPHLLPVTHAETPSPALIQGTWVQDSEVTFVGKTAARAGSFLDWTLANYNWVQLGSTEANPLIPFWVVIRNIVYAIFALFILSTAFLMIITRGKNLSFAKFIPRFIGIFLLVTFSFGVVQIIYQISDIVQGFFLRNPDVTTQAAHAIISQQNLLNVGFDYSKFVGYRLLDSSGDESAAITLLLTKLTAVTYYAMSAMLIIRKIVMWFFIIISPIFPLLLFYWPIRNTAKIWIGEFFRWALYGPLFALLLAGLVSLWSSAIPLFTYQSNGSIVTKSTQIIYPTVVNILLGGPGQAIAFNNSVNLPETFALYMICLMMLWAVLILPFILLRIFLDYLFNLALAEGMGAKQFIALTNSLVNRPPSPGPSPLPSFPTGAAKALPFGKKLTIPEQTPVVRTVVPAKNARTIPTTTSIEERLNESRPVLTDTSRTNQVMHLMNLSVPTMRDVAVYESAQLSSQSTERTNTQTPAAIQNLQLVARPELARTQSQRDQYEKIRERLVTESRKGNILATNILTAANTTVTNQVTTGDDKQILVTILNNIATPERVSQITEKTTYEQIKETVSKEAQQSNPLATIISQYLMQRTNQDTQVSSSQTQNVNNTNVQHVVENLVNPAATISEVDKQTIILLKEEITREAVLQNPLATQLLNMMQGNAPVSQSAISSITNQITNLSQTNKSVVNYITQTLPKDSEITTDSVATFIQSIANPALLPQGEKEKVETIRETIVQDSAKGDTLAQTLLPVVQSSQNITPELVSKVTSMLSQVKGQVTLQTLMSSLIHAPAPVSAPLQSESLTKFIQKILTVQTLTDPEEKKEILALIEQIKLAASRGDVLAKTLTDLMTRTQSVTQESLLNITQQIRLEDTKNNPVVSTIVAVMNTLEKSVSVEKVKEEVVKAKDKGDKLGALLYAMLMKQRQKKAVGQQVGKAPTNAFPVANRIQTVSIEDYEAVKKIWKDNYKNLDNPMRNGQPVSKGNYIQSDIDDITLAINLLSSPIPEKRQDGMDKVSSILPFLLLGGFSQTEIVGYLKAKQEAAKDVLEDVTAKEEDEDMKVARQTVKAQNTAHLSAEAEESEEPGVPEVSENTPHPIKREEDEQPFLPEKPRDESSGLKPLEDLDNPEPFEKKPLKQFPDDES
jgi:hypothetical protein